MPSVHMICGIRRHAFSYLEV